MWVEPADEALEEGRGELPLASTGECSDEALDEGRGETFLVSTGECSEEALEEGRGEFPFSMVCMGDSALPTLYTEERWWGL